MAATDYFSDAESNALHQLWCLAFHNITEKSLIKFNQKSPTIGIDGWTIAAEHRRGFRSVVFKKDDQIDVMIAPRLGWIPESNQKKRRWHFRLKITPDQIHQLIDQLKAYSIESNIPVSCRELSILLDATSTLKPFTVIPEPPQANFEVIAESHIDFYNRMANCSISAEWCNVIRNDQGNVPRGYFTLAVPGDSIDLMLVGQNPGRPKDAEKNMYTVGSDIARIHLGFTRSLFIDELGSTFHRTVNRWISEIVARPFAEVWKHCVYTNIVKCTTHRDKNNHDKVPCREALRTCTKKWFRDEIALWKPKIIIGMGSFASQALKSIEPSSLAMLHPCHYEGKADEDQRLAELCARISGMI